MSDISVTVVGVTNVTASVANNNAVNVAAGSTSGTVLVSSGPGFGPGGATALLVEAGANITVTTAQGAFVVAGRDVPVTSVNGRTGAVVLAASDIGGLTAVGNVTKVNGKTGAVTLVSTDVSAASAVHSHVAADISNLTSVANVVSVNGRTGAVSLVSTDVSAASAVHSHVAADITNLTAVANVVSVNGITGSPTIVAGSNVTVVTAGSSITISASGGGGTTGGSVSSVNGKVGTVVLTSVDVSAASASHSHVASGITDLTSVANVVSVNGKTGVVSLVATDVTAAAASHGHSYVTSLNSNTGALSIVAGSNVTVTTSGASIVIDGPTVTQGAQGPPGSFGDPQTISQKTASYTLQLSDVGTLLTCSGTAGTIVLTVPLTASVSWVQGSHIDVARIGAAGVSVSGQSGVSILATPSPSLRDTGSGGSLVYLGSNQWLLVGDLA